MTEQWKMNDEHADSQTTSADDQSGGEETDSSEPRKAGLNTNTLWVFGTFAIALALIWALGKQGGPRPASAAESSDANVDTAIQEFMQRSGNGDKAKDLFSDTDQLVRMFYNYPGVSSVPLEELPVNPFEHDGPRAETNTTVAPVIPDNLSAAEAARLQRLAESFNSLKLSTILVSKVHSAALINNHLVMVGAKIGEFVVADIQPQRVILNAGTSYFELKLAQPNGGQTQNSNDP